METEKELNSKIIKITGQIQEEFPELYSNLGEMPVTIPSVNKPIISVKILKEYYDSLTSMFRNYKNTHRK